MLRALDLCYALRSGHIPPVKSLVFAILLYVSAAQAEERIISTSPDKRFQVVLGNTIPLKWEGNDALICRGPTPTVWHLTPDKAAFRAEESKSKKAR